MSYSSMAREAVACDFPYCGKEYEQTEGALCALPQPGSQYCMAFCMEHSLRLINEGVSLRSLKDIREETAARKQAKIDANMAVIRRSTEEEFIKKLKDPG